MCNQKSISTKKLLDLFYCKMPPLLFCLSIYLSLLIYFITLLLDGLIKGGRWDLNNHIAFGDRLVNGIAYYANGSDDLFPPSSPYFPGVGLISYALETLVINSYYSLNIAMIFSAILVGFGVLILLQLISKMLNNNVTTNFSLSVIILFFIEKFELYKEYMIEFKPDSILLLLIFFIFGIIESHKTLPWKRFLIAIILLFVSIFMKQASFLACFMMLFLIMLKYEISFKTRIIYSLLTLLVTILGLFLISRIENCWYYTITVMSQHSFLGLSRKAHIEDFLKYILNDFKMFFWENFVYFCAYIMYIIKNFQKLKVLRISIIGKYIIFSIIWFLFSLVSAMKTGGNYGNLEAGILPFFPIVIIFFFQLSSRINKKLIFKSFLIILLAFSVDPINRVKNNINKFTTFENKRILDYESSKFLKDRFNGNKVLADGNTYINAKSGGLNIITDAEAISHFNNIYPKFNFDNLKSSISNQIYDIIYISESIKIINNDLGNKIEENYQVYNPEDLPYQLKDKILIRSIA